MNNINYSLLNSRANNLYGATMLLYGSTTIYNLPKGKWTFVVLAEISNNGRSGTSHYLNLFGQNHIWLGYAGGSGRYYRILYTQFDVTTGTKTKIINFNRDTGKYDTLTYEGHAVGSYTHESSGNYGGARYTKYWIFGYYDTYDTTIFTKYYGYGYMDDVAGGYIPKRQEIYEGFKDYHPQMSSKEYRDSVNYGIDGGTPSLPLLYYNNGNEPVNNINYTPSIQEVVNE